jgi:hypothetical protein
MGSMTPPCHAVHGNGVETGLPYFLPLFFPSGRVFPTKLNIPFDALGIRIAHVHLPGYIFTRPRLRNKKLITGFARWLKPGRRHFQ